MYLFGAKTSMNQHQWHSIVAAFDWLLAVLTLQILGDAALRQEWEEELKSFSERIKKMRQLIYDRYTAVSFSVLNSFMFFIVSLLCFFSLVELQTPGTWERILKQIGISHPHISFSSCPV